MRYTEVELSSARLDQPRQDESPRRKILILSPPRSGSFMLCRMMLRAGLGIPHEYFNPIHIRLIGRRAGMAELESPKALQDDARLALRYIHHLFAIRTRAQLFSAKIQFAQFAQFLKGLPGQVLFDGATLVLLTRRDVVAQAVSLHVAQVTGRWGFEPTRLTRQPAPRELGDVAGISAAIARVHEEERCWEKLFRDLGQSPLRLTYEALCADGPGTLARIAAHAGVELDGEVPTGEEEGRYPEEEGQEVKASLAAQYRQLMTLEGLPIARAS